MEKHGQSTWKNVPQVMRVEQGSELTFWTALYGMVSWWVTSPRDENRALEQLGSYPVIHFCFRRVYFYTYCLLYRGVLGMNTGSALPATRNRWLTLNRGGGGTSSSHRDIIFSHWRRSMNASQERNGFWEVTWANFKEDTLLPKKEDLQEFLLQGDWVTRVEPGPTMHA